MRIAILLDPLLPGPLQRRGLVYARAAGVAGRAGDGLPGAHDRDLGPRAGNVARRGAHHTRAYRPAVPGASGNWRGGPTLTSLGRRESPLRSIATHRRLTDRPMDCNHALRTIKRRARAVGLSRDICCRAFRAAGITAYLEGGGRRNHACGGMSVSQQPAMPAGCSYSYCSISNSGRPQISTPAGSV